MGQIPEYTLSRLTTTVAKPKRVTRKVAAISLLALIITGLGWLVVLPHLLAFGALTPDEVISNPKNYVGKKVSVVGYYLSSLGVFDYDGWVFSEESQLTDFEDRTEFFSRWCSGELLPLAVELPPGEDADSLEKYVFTGVVKMEYVSMFRVKIPNEKLPRIVVSSLVEL